MASIITSTIAGDLVVDVEAGRPLGYWLTACCGAAVTGVCGGVACKGCYALVDQRLAWAWFWDNAEHVARLTADVAALLELPTDWAERLTAPAAAKAVA